MLNFLRTYLRHDWPVHFLLWLTNWLPENVIFLEFRGKLIRSFLGSATGRLLIGRNVSIQNPSKVFLGSQVYLAYGSCLLATDDICIGSNVLIGPYCVIVSGNHVRENGSYYNDKTYARQVTIEDGCWLGAHVVVTPGSSIAAGTCVAAGAVVHDTFKMSSLVAGVPARVIREYTD
jgi:acetyltransferase-like isoleucine patch superfamily enzyme